MARRGSEQVQESISQLGRVSQAEGFGGRAKMSVVGFDVGNQRCIVAVPRQGGFDLVLNDESKMKNPAIVYFGKKQRFIGTDGACLSLINPKNAVSHIKRLIGKKFYDPEVQRDLQSLPFTVSEAPDGGLQIHVRYGGDDRVFGVTQILAILLSNLKQIAKTNLKTEVVDCCIGIPIYFTDLQRRAFLDAASIAGLNPVRLMHETTATALAYGIYKTNLRENDLLNVVFVDIGHASMQVCVAAFKKGQLNILAQTYDRSLGGRDFDEVLFRHFANKFKEQYQIDLSTNVRASQRLRENCERLKKLLSAQRKVHIHVKCLIDEKGVRGSIKRHEFEQLAQPMLERVKGPCVQALIEAGITVDKIHLVKVVGSGSRIPAIKKILTETFGKEPRRIKKANVCVAGGCALQYAIRNPTFEVREFKVQESFPFSIALAWKGAAPEAERKTKVVFPRGNTLPDTKTVRFFRSGNFGVDILYADVNQVPAPALISSYEIGPVQTSKGEKAKVKVRVRLDKHGIVSIDRATAITVKKMVKETKVPFSERVFGAMPQTDVQKATDEESEMALQDMCKKGKAMLDELIDELKNQDIQLQLNSIRRLSAIARALGKERTRKELIPFLSENNVDNNELLLAMAVKLGFFIPYVGGVDYAHVLLPPLETLCTVEETCVRDKAVESLCRVGSQMKEDYLVDWFIPLVKSLAAGERFTARVSACGLFHIAYPSAPECLKAELLHIYGQLCRDDRPMVRVSAATNLGKYAATVEPQYLKTDIMSFFEDLTHDGQDFSVRLSAVEGCAALGKLLEQHDCVARILPVIIKFSQVIEIDLLSQSLLPAIVELAEHRHWRVRLAIIEYIPLLATRLGVEFFDDKLGSLCMHWLGDQVCSIRDAAANNLKRLAEEFGPEWAIQHIVPQVLEKINNPHYLCRMTILKATSLLAPVMGQEITCQTMLPVVINASKDRVPNVKFNVAKVLESLIPIVDHLVVEQSIRPCLVELSEDPDVDVRFFAGQALQACDQVMMST